MRWVWTAMPLYGSEIRQHAAAHSIDLWVFAPFHDLPANGYPVIAY